MQLRLKRLIIVRSLAAMLCVATALPAPFIQARGAGDGSAFRPGAPAQGQPVHVGVAQAVQGVSVTADELRRRNQAAPMARPHQANPRRTFAGVLASTPNLTASPNERGGSGSQPIGPDLPQTLGDEIIGPTEADSGSVPPDTMGAVGSIDFLFTVNGRFRGFLKDPPHTQVFDTTDAAFWGTIADPAGVSDPHVRYDRATQRWIITEIDVPTNNNHILLAVSSGPDLSTASWTGYQLPGTGADAAADLNCFVDYDTPGIDQNAIYIGANMFGGGAAPCAGGSYKHSNLYVVQKAPTLSGSATWLNTFYNVVGGVLAVATIQGADSFDSLPTGYAVAVNESANPRSFLNVWQINNPGTISPTLSGPTTVAISPENGVMGGVVSANNVNSADPTRGMDDLDDRLFAAVIRDGHLWTAHNVAVDLTGNSNGGARTRDAVRWYDIDVSGLTLHQSGTVFDGTASGFLHYWMGTIMPSGQGHVALGLNRANNSTVVQAGSVGRLSGDVVGTMRGFSLFQNSTTDSYDDASFNPNPTNRWGDYSYTSLDPCDDMTLWTTQEYVANSSFNTGWGVAAEKLFAPPPATPVSASTYVLAAGQPSVTVAITGTSVNGSGFYNTPNSLTDPCRKTITASASHGVTVIAITYTDSTHVQLSVSTLAAISGTATITVTNPDRQSSSAALFQIIATTLTSSSNPSFIGQPITLTATVTGSTITPTGNITFFDGASPLGTFALSGGVATHVTSTLPVGLHTLTAAYGGDSIFPAVTSAPLMQMVAPYPVNTTLTSSSNPSFIGQPITLTAAVTGSIGTPTGNVTFFDGASPLSTIALSEGVATYVTSTLAVGLHTLTATYSGDATFSVGTSAPLMQTVAAYLIVLPLILRS
jgi:hypothetical protein